MWFKRHQYVCVVRVSISTGLLGWSQLACGWRERTLPRPCRKDPSSHFAVSKSKRVKLRAYQAAFKGKWRLLTFLDFQVGFQNFFLCLFNAPWHWQVLPDLQLFWAPLFLGTMKAPGFHKTISTSSLKPKGTSHFAY